MAKKQPQLTRAQAEDLLRRKASKKHNADDTAATANAEWAAACLDSFNAGLTYPEIAAISGLTRPRIDQVLRAERVRRGIPINTKEAS